MHAIVIATLGEARDVELPDDDGHHAEIRRILGGTPDQAVYHREALLWIHRRKPAVQPARQRGGRP